MKGHAMPKVILLDNREYYSAADAARLLGITRARVSQLCKTNKLNVRYIGANALIPVSDVMMYKALEGTDARKPGRKSDMR